MAEIETNFTPGPWSALGAKRPIDGGWDSGIVATIDARTVCIAEAFEVVGENLRAPAFANAHLIASAPDLYAALETTLNRYVELAASGDCGHWDPETEPHVIAARAALAKARGEG